MSSNRVYTGFWRDWNTNETMSGLTLTISPSQGPFLISFLALFVGVVSGQLWSIFCFVLHQIRSTPTDRDGLHHELQVLLRNSSGSASFLWMLFKLTRTWRKKVRRISRTFYLALPALVHLSAMSVAGIFSSRITLSGNEVLVRGETCGWMGAGNLNYTDKNYLTAKEFQDAASADWTMARWQAMKALEYAKTCYNLTNLADSGACNLYSTPKINITINNQTPCPFDKDICATPQGITIDTGLIDSNSHLGINSNPSTRLQSRKVMMCAPILAEERYSTGWETQDSLNTSIEYSFPGDQYKLYYLGPRVVGDETVNFTWSMSNYSIWLQNTMGYHMFSHTFFSGTNTSSWLPIPQLQVDNADISIVTLSSNIGFPDKVLDPWFQATSTNNSYLTGSSENFIPSYVPTNDVKLSYYPDHLLSVLACTEQYQFCNTTHCSQLSGIFSNTSTSNFGLELNSDQQAIFNLVYNAISDVTINLGVYFLGDDLLLAKEKIWSGSAAASISSDLPPNQWEKEAVNMVNVMLAALQRLVVDYASPPDIPLELSTGQASSLSFISPPQTEAEKRACDIIRIRNSAYYNFNVAGLVIVLSLGLAIIFVNVVCLPGAVFWARGKVGLNGHPRDEWMQTSVLALYRTAVENHGVGPWAVSERGDIPYLKNSGIQFSAERAWKRGNIERTFESVNSKGSGIVGILEDGSGEGDEMGILLGRFPYSN